MRKKSLTRALAMMFALVMTLSTCSAALANDYTYPSYQNAVTSSANTLYEELMQCTTALELVTAYEQKTSDQVLAFKMTLDDETRSNLENHIDTLIAAMTPEDSVEVAVQLGAIREEIATPHIVSYTNVGPLLDTLVDTSGVSAASYSLLSSSRSATDTNNNGLYLAKTSVPNADGKTYTVTLEVYSTGSVTTNQKPVPVDIVLVLDESGSMSYTLAENAVYTLDTSKTYYVQTEYGYMAVKYCDKDHKGTQNDHSPGWFLYGSEYADNHYGIMYTPKTSADDTNSDHVQFYERQTRNQALESAAKKFVQNVYNDATANSVDHRIAVVGFSGDGNASIKEGLEDIRTNKADVDTAIDNLKTSGGTYIEDGLTQAIAAFDNAPATTNTTRKRVVIIFTDGVPGTGDWDDDETIEDSANPAINTAKTLKALPANDGYGATVYTIGLLEGADPAAAISYGDSDNARTNRFLHFLSSNYPDAESMAKGNTGSNKGYYLAPQNAAELDEIFQKISEEVSTPTIDLDETTTIQDIVTPYFDLPDNATAVRVTAVPCTGYTDGSPTWTTDENKMTVLSNAATFTDKDGDGENDTVNVTGFNFNENFVSSTPRTSGNNTSFYGQKLVIEFTITPTEGFLGGNQVPTNTSAGVYKGETKIDEFPVPDVDVFVQDVVPDASPVLDGANQHIYLTNSADLTQLIEKMGYYEVDGTTYQADGQNNAYVDLIYEIKDKAGTTVIGTYTISAGQTTGTWTAADGQTLMPALTTNTDYTISCTIHPTQTGTYTDKTKTDTVTVFVYKPQLTFNDSEIQYNQEVPEATKTGYAANGGAEKWLNENGTDSADVEKMHGTKPVLELVYKPDSAKITDGKFTATDYVAVDVAVKLDDGDSTTTNEDITAKVTFVHETCTVTGCVWDKVKSDPLNGSPAFLLHVTTGELTITKTVVNNTGFTPTLTEFNFTLSLKDAEGNELSATQTFPIKGSDPAATVANGSTFKLEDGESITIEGLPAGTQYAIVETEANTMGYVTTYDKATGSIVSGSNAAEITNTYNVGSLTISKTVSGDDAPADTFEFNVNLPNGKYKYQVITKNSDQSETAGAVTELPVNNGTAQFNLTDKQRVVITGFPVNEEYTVAETVKTEYTTKVSLNGGTPEEETSLGTKGTVTVDMPNHTVAYTNTYQYSHLTIQKTNMSSGNAIMNVKVGETNFQIVLNSENNWKQTISHLKIGDTFTVSEVEGWTWRYGTPTITTTPNGATAIVEGGVTVTVANPDPTDQWLDDESSTKNEFDGDLSD